MAPKDQPFSAAMTPEQPFSAAIVNGDGTGGPKDGAPAAGEDQGAQELMKDNLELMKDIVMRIREDPDFAKSIYANCPRLQHLLAKHPDLRPIFEDPKLVRINFEKVYRDAGGRLPEDPPPKVSLYTRVVTAVVNHPLFKVVKVFLMLKKVVNCIFGGGLSMIRGCAKSLFCSAEDALDQAQDGADGDGGDGDGGDGGDNEGKEKEHEMSEQNKANKANLERAAEHMEQPEVQEQMNDLLENDPDQLNEVIENDPELKALRDSNELCAELMSSPDTMKILVDPENLRALGDAPDLIEQDFANPNWTPPDVEMGGVDGLDSGGAMENMGPSEDLLGADNMDMDAPELEGGDELDFGEAEAEAEADGDFEGEAEGEGEADGEGDGEGGEEEEEEEGGALEDFELGDEEDGGGKTDQAKNAKAKSAQKSKSAAQQKSRGAGGGDEPQTMAGRMQGFMSQVGAGMMDMVAGELVGTTVSELTGGDDDLGGLEDQADQAASAAEGAEEAANQAEGAADKAASAAEGAEAMVNSDAVGNLEEAADKVEEVHDEQLEELEEAVIEQEGSKDGERSARGGAAAAGAEGAVVASDGSKSRAAPGEEKAEEEEEEEEEEEPEEEKKKGRFGFVGDFLGSVASAGKEYVATTLLGDDLGEMLVEEIEEEDEDEEGDDDKKDGKDGDKEGKEGKEPEADEKAADKEPAKTRGGVGGGGSRGGLFRRNR